MSQAALKYTEYANVEDQNLSSDQEQTVGLILRMARENKHESLEQISRILRISETYLSALESDDRSRLPELVYTIGFLKTYARYLQLNQDDLVKQFKKQFTQSIKSETLIFPMPAPERSIPTMTLVIIAGGLSLLIAVAWLYLRPTSEVIDEFQHLTPIVNPTVDAVPEKVETPASVEVAAETAETSTSVPATPAPQAYTQAYPIFPIQDSRPYAETRAATIKVTDKGIYLGPGKSFIVHAQADSWVEIRSDKGQVLLSKVLKEGDSQEFAVSERLTLSTGNAAGLSFYVDGKYYAGLGQDKEVLKNKTLFFESPQD